MRWVAAALTFLFLLGTGMAAAIAQRWPVPDRLISATLTYVRPEWRGSWSIPPNGLIELQTAHREAIGIYTPSWPDHYSNYQLQLEYTDGPQILYVSWDQVVYCPSSQTAYHNLQAIVDPYTEALDGSFFGADLAWSLVGRLWPRKTKALVTDLDSNRSFWLFRWGGNLHADVEPVSAEDAQIMKEVFGEYTWRRRAVVVELEGRRIAGSLHSMPHGGGDISGNQFSGHCCLHFFGSKTHGSRRQDPAHHIMMLKAAGLWWQTLLEHDAAQWMSYYLVLMAQRDVNTLELFTTDSQRDTIRQHSTELTSLNIANITLIAADANRAEVGAELTLYRQGDANCHDLKPHFYLERDPVSRVWQLVDLTGW